MALHPPDPRQSPLPLSEYRPLPRLRVPEHPVPRARFQAVDAHNHLGRWLGHAGRWTVPDVGALLETMDRCNVRAVVNLDGRWGEELESNLDRYDRAHPGRFATFCHVDWTAAQDRGFGEHLAASLRGSLSRGAAGLKVWKDLGLRIRDGRGDLLFPDDPRLSPLWEAAAEMGVPVAIHIGDPVAFFDPADQQNERLEERLAHPDWSFADPGFPRFDRLMETLEGLVAENLATTFVGVHMGGYAENLGWVERMLHTYPNFHVDIAARLAELGRQPRATRDLFLRHSDRILFGTDVFPPRAEEYAIHFRFLETADEYFSYSTEEIPPQGRWAIYGLELPHEILRKVYSENARRLIVPLPG